MTKHKQLVIRFKEFIQFLKHKLFYRYSGIHKPKHRLGDFMVESAYNAMREVDATLFMVSADQKRGKGDDFIIERLKIIIVQST